MDRRLRSDAVSFASQGSYDPAYIKAIKRHSQSHRAWVAAAALRGVRQDEWNAFFRAGIDIVLAPVARTPAFEYDFVVLVLLFWGGEGLALRPSLCFLGVAGEKADG